MKKFIQETPKLIIEFDKKRNKVDPSTLPAYSHKKYWWICNINNNHKWQASLSNKVNSFKKHNSLKKNSCPFCANKFVSDENNLEKYLIKNNKKDLINYYSKKNKINIKKILPSTMKKYFWNCILCKEPFLVRPRDFFRDGRKRVNHCSKCKFITRGKNYAKGQIKRYGSILDINPRIKEIWDYKKNKKKPSEYSRYSHEKVWFKCIYGHSFYANIYNKVKELGCPKCYSKGSKAEVRIYSELYKIFNKHVHWHKKFGKIELDIYIENLSLGIEVDGYPWHLNKTKKDLKKNKFFENLGIKIIRVRDPKLDKFKELNIKSNLTNYTFNDYKKLILQIIKLTNNNLLKNYLKRNKKFNNENLYRKFLADLPKPFSGTSLGDKQPNISKEFDLKKNYPLTPFHFSEKSSNIVWWKCKINHSYKARIGDRTRSGTVEKRKDGSEYIRRKGTGCPYCAGRLADRKNNLKVKYPNLMKYYDSKFNSYKPENLTPKSDKEVFWRCKYNHRWKTSVKIMVNRKYKCVICK